MNAGSPETEQARTPPSILYLTAPPGSKILEFIAGKGVIDETVFIEGGEVSNSVERHSSCGAFPSPSGMQILHFSL
jgi:hypothetical protein